MSRAAPQLNIRSAYARERASTLARQTGKSTTEVVEEALRAYEPPPPADLERPVPPGMVRKGPLLVMESRGGRKITSEDVIASIEADREERAEHVWCGGD